VRIRDTCSSLFVRTHFERHFVVIAQKRSPLARWGKDWSLGENIGDRVAVLPAQGHEHARHKGKVERHVKLIALPKIREHISRPLIRFGQENSTWSAAVQFMT
jgi:hypothetical protein